MSQGAFENGRYQASRDPNNIHRIRVQPETKALVIDGVTNAYPSGATNAYPSAKVSGGRREIGLLARKVSIRFTGTAPTGYKQGGTIVLPWFVAATFNSLVEGQTGTYLGDPIELIGTTAEETN